ncbi:MAG: hypothetical protein ACT4O6_16390 [Reyranella sp.]
MQQMPPLPEPEPFPSDPLSAYHRYNRALQLLMLDFQYIEEALRVCLVRDYALIHFRTKDVLHFKPPIKDLEKDPLGRLISKFEQFSNDSALVLSLREIQPFRNQCAHRGMLLTVEQQRDVQYLAAETAMMETKRKDTQGCFNKILVESHRLEAVLNDPLRRDQVERDEGSPLGSALDAREKP